MSTFNSKIISSYETLDNKLNEDWWQNNPMLYDWDKNFGNPDFNLNYFKQIDSSFVSGHSLCNNPKWPNGFVLENFIPYKLFNSKKVLEIGCGAGLVSSHLAISGANLSSIDITENAVSITKQRFQLFNLKANISRMDAERLQFPSESFDFVVSWGVIHHSGNMISIINEIQRVLKSNGKAFLMIYNKNSLRYRIYCPFWLGVFRMKFINKSFDQIVGSITDGYIARHLTKKEFTELISHKFNKVEFSLSDEENSISLYLMGPFRRILFFFPKFKTKIEKFLAERFGWYMQITLTK
jgi:2-polyprenyl-3-methyl-5-hydroxy-6-metoxy-1,4-benzoquinol methylase